MRLPDEVIDLVKEEVVARGRGRGDGRGGRGGGGRGRGGHQNNQRGKFLFILMRFLFK